MKKTNLFKRNSLIAIVFLLSLLCQEQNAQAEITLTKIWQVPTQEIKRAVFSPNDSLIFTLGTSGLWIYNKETGDKIKEFNYQDFLFSKNQNIFIAGITNNTKKTTIDFIDLNSLSIQKSIILNTDENINDLRIFFKGNEGTIAMICTYGVYIYDANTGNLIKKISGTGLGHPIVTPDGKYLFYEPSGDGKKAYSYLWRKDLETGKDTLVEINGDEPVLSPDGKYLAYHMAWATQPYNGRIINPNTLQEIWKTINPSSSFLFTKNSKALFIQGVYTDTLHHLIYRLNDEIKLFDILSIYKDWLKDISNFENYIISYDGGDYFLKLFGISGFSEVNNTTLENVQIVYPNPANKTINVSFQLEKPSFLNYSISDGTGKNIKPLLDEFTPSGKISKTFDLSDFSSGNYFLIILGDNFKKSFKIIINK